MRHLFLNGTAHLFLATILLIIAPKPVLASCLDRASMNDKIECLEQKINALNSIPQDAVVAFTSQTCPQGWREYSKAKGRVIVGAGQNNDLTHRYLNQTGGKEKHTLTLSELPSHSHRVSAGRADTDIGGAKLPYVGTAHGPWQTSDAGGSQPHNNMPPFVVLTICEKQ